MHEREFGDDAFVLPLIQSALLEEHFHHGFTSRKGGVSAAPFDSLNLGGKWGDAPESVAENARRLRAVCGNAIELHFATQVHEARVAVVRTTDRSDETRSQRADALLSPSPGPAVGVFVADCVPILIGDVHTGACAAVHAGWRGTVASVLSATIARLMETPGARASSIRAAIGPSIGPCCFEVGADVVLAVEQAFPWARDAGVFSEVNGRSHVDLWTLNRR